MDSETGRIDSYMESAMNDEDKQDHTDENGADGTINSSSELTSPETCRAGIDE
ncbi:hypothetical protein [Paenibacillus sedimenti]|uniref:Uncharacterized protein n=1 Tax=Paenibacillus sedimenti TaxID=2770274 RepID=A0A926KUI9_9BACL|nr:hypothetical protein [Paenibacillus sedimenti]MBD0382493.1 hypothetical protein [Paenibacillus sedimenti]